MHYLEYVIDIMIYAGSLLMIYNIARCYGFVRRMKAEETSRGRHMLLYVPLGLLVSFLVGYVVVGVFGEPDIIVAGILFGGSVFVLLVLGIMYDIIDRLRAAKAESEVLYEGVRGDLSMLTEEYITVLKANLTTDQVEELDGNQLYESDLAAKTFSELIAGRRVYLLSEPTIVHGFELLSCAGLLKCYEQGERRIEDTVLCLSAAGKPVFVHIEITLSTLPATGDVVALITERMCTDDLVNEVILNKALADQFDMITCLIGGHYEVMIGNNSAAKRGSIFPKTHSGEYASYLANQVAPVITGTDEQKRLLLEALSPERVDAELRQNDRYEVNISCLVSGEVFYKRFVFYVIDAATKAYLLLKSDTTAARLEEIERNARLQEALDEARRASQAKTAFLSNMSHDIRTPMNAIVGYTEFAKRSDSVDEMRDYLQKIDASSGYLLALINDVLEMSRIESGKLELEMEDVDLSRMMRDIQAMFETQMAEKGVAFEVRCTSLRNKLVRCDETRFNRVLLNLLSNAYKFTPTGGSVTVTLMQQNEAEPGYASYQISVKDTGIGMSPEFAARVFEAFERERNTTASGIQGTGLGMAITKRIVDMMGGTIDVLSEQGRGTECVVSVQLQTREAEPEEQVEETPSVADESIDFEGMRVLLAEDNEINREIACMLLEELGFVLDEAVNGQEALDKLVDAGPGYYDLVITDIQMPVMGGYDEARAIRALEDPDLARIPIIAMSANAFHEDIAAAMAVGMNGYVSKPIDMGKVIDEITRVMLEAHCG